MQASRQNLNFVYLQKTKIFILHLVAIKTISTHYCNGNQIHLVTKHSFLRSGGICIKNLSFLCFKMTEIETFILLSWQLIYSGNHTQKLLFMSTVTSIPNLGLLYLQTAEISKYRSVAMVACFPKQRKYEGMKGSCLLNFL